MVKIGIGLPAYGSRVFVNHDRMMLSFGHALGTHGDRFVLQHFAALDVPDVAVVRNFLTQAALDAGCDWLLMIDSDTWEEDGYHLLQMISTGEKEKAAVIAAPVKRRDGIYNYLVKEGEEWLQSRDVRVASAVFPVSRIGTAMWAMNLNWLRSQPDFPLPWFQKIYYSPKPGERVNCDDFMGEDYFFCDAVNKCGGKILCDSRFLPKHATGANILG